MSTPASVSFTFSSPIVKATAASPMSFSPSVSFLFLFCLSFFFVLWKDKKTQHHTLCLSYSAVGIYLQRTYYENHNFHVEWETCSSDSYM